MLRSVLGALYAKEEARFPTVYSPTLAAQRLVAHVKRWVFQTLFKEAVIGKVSRERVVLYRYRPMIHNSFAQFFTGHFEVITGQTVLVGHFSLHWWVRAFMTFWFSVLAISLVGEVTVSLIRGDDLAKAIPVIAVTVGLACFGLLLVRSGQWFARGDREYISNVIRTALGQEGRGHKS
jgi:hypothetical protein